ncbi:MAG: rod shape-determining protein MreC [Anaerolineae bacterium]
MLAITLLILHESGVIAPLENGLQYVTAPLQRAASQMADRLGGLFTTVRDVRELEAEVEELRRERDALLSDNIRLQQYEATTVQLRELLNFREGNPTWAFLGADVVGQGEVIGQEPNPYLRYLTISAGSEEGIEIGMPVIAGGAVLIGRIAEVGPHTAKVQLLSDTASSVAVRLQESRTTGLVVGQPDASLRMVYIPQTEEVQPEEVVFTSGLGGSMPRGLVIGQVAEVIQQDFAFDQEALIRPALDYHQVEMVLIITSFQPSAEEATEEPATEP